MKKISVVITTYNSEAIIKRCLESVTWADEIIVVDMESTDKTVEVVKKFTNHIFSHKNPGFVEPARNFSIAKATGDWILILDSDETIPESLAKKLKDLAQDETQYSFVKLPRKNIILGKWVQHTGWWPDHLIRFFKKGSVTWLDEIHSVPQTIGDGLTLDQEEYAIIHQNYESIIEFFHKNFETYAMQEAEDKLKNGYVFDYKDAIRFPVAEFLRRYFLWEGYKDGLHGLVLSVFMAFYHFAIFAYLWEKNKFVEISNVALERNLADIVKESENQLSFWNYSKRIQNEKNNLKKVALRIRRKFTLRKM